MNWIKHTPYEYCRIDYGNCLLRSYLIPLETGEAESIRVQTLPGLSSYGEKQHNTVSL